MKASKQLVTVNTAINKIDEALATDPRLVDSSRYAYRHSLFVFEEWRSGRPFTKMLVEAYAAKLQGEGKSPNTINRVLAALRWWARRVADMAHESRMTKDQREEIVAAAGRVASVKDVKGERETRGRHIDGGEIDALLRSCLADGSAAGVRDAALLAVEWQLGARRSELAGLELADLKETGEREYEIVIRHGKGDKVRRGYLNDGAASYLADWLQLRGKEPGPLFYAINKGGRVLVGHGVSDEALAQMLEKRSEQAGVTEITWHDFRRTFAGNLLDGGADLVTVQKLMGHSSPTTTAAYDRRGDEVKRKAVRTLHVPYRKRAV